MTLRLSEARVVMAQAGCEMSMENVQEWVAVVVTMDKVADMDAGMDVAKGRVMDVAKAWGVVEVMEKVMVDQVNVAEMAEDDKVEVQSVLVAHAEFQPMNYRI